MRAPLMMHVAFGLMIAVCSIPVATRAAQRESLWLVASDIHLNPFDRSPEPRLFGSDTNVALFESSIAAMKRDVPDPAVVLLPGDFFAHDFAALAQRAAPKTAPYDAGIATMRRIESDLHAAFPKAQFAVALGNNDDPCGDYRSETGGSYLAAVARVWAPLVNRAGAAPDFIASFTRGGYYTARLPVAGLRLVAINSVFFSGQYKGSCGRYGPRDPAAVELAWLQSTLRATPAGTRNVVMMHVPPGFDAFSTQVTHGFVPWRFMQRGDDEALRAALASPDDRVSIAFAGHEHRFDFRIIGNVPLVVFGSISPVYRSNPSFYGVHVGSNGSLRDIDAYVFDEWTQTWIAGRSFDRKWSVDRVDARSLSRLRDRLAVDPALRSEWDAGSSGWPSNRREMSAMWGKRWQVPWCAQTVFDSGFAQCAGIGRRVIFARVAVLAVGAAAIALIVLVVAIVRRRRFLSRGSGA